MDRKDFLKSFAAVALGTNCLPFVLSGCVEMASVAYTRERDRIIVRKADFGERPFVSVRVADLPTPIYLRRLGEDRYTALLLRCTHKGCEVQPAFDLLECPCHGSQYSPTGEVVRSPAERPLLRFAATSDAENIYIELN